jgi:hypothetical protein
MTQRRLDPEPEPDEGAGEDASHAVETAEEPPTEATSPATPRIVLDGPSDTELRKRQAAWFAERARHEALRRSARVDEGTK